MHVVILAAGKGTRMGELVHDRPKPMLEVHGKTLIQHKLDALPADVTDIIMVVGYLKEVIMAYFGDSYGGRKITYVTQQNFVGGTMDALAQAKPYLKEKFLVLSGDDLYARKDLEQALKYDWAVIVNKVDELGSAGSVVVENGLVANIIEKEGHSGGPGYANAGAYVLDPRIFSYTPVARTGSHEYGLPQTMISAARDIPIHAVEATFWIQITTPEDLERAEILLASR